MGRARHGFFGSLGDLQYRRSYKGNGIPLPRNHFAGLQTVIAADTAHDVTIAIGQARNTGDASNIIVDSAITKRIDATWAAGTGNGGLTDDAAAANDTWYHLFVLGNAGGNQFDAGWDTDPAAATLLVDSAVVAAGFTKYRRVASMLSDGSAELSGYVQVGNLFLPKVIGVDTPTCPADDTPTDVVLSGAPTGVSNYVFVNIRFDHDETGESAIAWFYSPDQADEAGAVSTVSAMRVDNEVGNFDNNSQQYMIRTNTSAAIRMEVNTTGSAVVGTTRYAVTGWLDDFGQYD